MYANFHHCQNQLQNVQAIDYFLAKQVIISLDCADDELLFHTIIAISMSLREGHSCLLLSAVASTNPWSSNLDSHVKNNELEQDKPGYTLPALSAWFEHLEQIKCHQNDANPIVLEFERLYLRRYWQFEQELATLIRPRLNTSLNTNLITQKTVDVVQSTKVLATLFNNDSASDNLASNDSPNTDSDSKDSANDNSATQKNNETDWQKVAVANSLNKSFSIIVGGPGTGKTTTVTKLLVALQQLNNNQLTIAMAAPTGKAAQRLNQSIANSKSALAASGLEFNWDNIPENASTIHRLLGVQRNSHNFKHNQDNLLQYDVLLLDEVSMIDLPLMTRIFRALSPTTRLIMLGDAQQLPSVAAGSVLADLASISNFGYSQSNMLYLSQILGSNLSVVVGKQDHLAILHHSFRFASDGGIGKLANSVISGQTQQSWALIQHGDNELALINSDMVNNDMTNDVSVSHFNQWLLSLATQYYKPLLSAETIDHAFAQLEKFRILAAVKLGQYGVMAINETIEKHLNKGDELYAGKPIMVSENNHSQKLYNGDIGLIWPDDSGRLQAVFPTPDGQLRWLAPSRLPQYETVYAMTIHKTQGSEFDQVAMILPEQDSAILSRELLYTGITRAKNKLFLWANKSVWQTSVNRKIERFSGLMQQLELNKAE